MCAHHCPRYVNFFGRLWHTVFFSLDGMKQLMAKHGFELLHIHPEPQGRMQGVMGLAQLAPDQRPTDAIDCLKI